MCLHDSVNRLFYLIPLGKGVFFFSVFFFFFLAPQQKLATPKYLRSFSIFSIDFTKTDMRLREIPKDKLPTTANYRSNLDFICTRVMIQ